MSRPFVVTPADLEAVIEITRAIADTVRELTKLKGGVSNGELYSTCMAAGMNLSQYGAVIEALEGAGIIEVENHWVKYVEKEGV